MRFARALLSFIFMLASAGCTLVMLEGAEGVIWDHSLQSPVTHGLIVQDNNLYAAAEDGGVISFWMDTGMLRWKRFVRGEGIISIATVTSGLMVFSTNSTGTTGRLFSTELGELTAEKVYPHIFNTTLVTDEGLVLMASGSRIYRIQRNLEAALTAQISGLNVITSLVAVPGGYFIIDNETRIVRTDADFNTLWANSESAGASYFGSAFYSGGRLFYAAREGLAVLSEKTRKLEKIGWKGETAMRAMSPGALKSYLSLAESDPAADPVRDGIWGSPTGWYQTAFDGVTYSPIVISGGIPAVAAVDSKGYLAVIDRTTGQLLSSKFVGSLEKPGLTIPADYSGKAIFIPASSPARVLCFSLDYALKNRMK